MIFIKIQMGNCCQSDNDRAETRLVHHQAFDISNQSQLKLSKKSNMSKDEDIMMVLPLNYVYKLFRDGHFAQAAEMLKKYIAQHPLENEEIDGLGNYCLAQGYYQWFLYWHYSDGIRDGVYKGTAHDALSLCYLALSQDEQQLEKGMKWYRLMIQEYPESYQLHYGYANILQNSGNCNQALKYYYKVIEMRPNWVKPYECIAFIYQQELCQKQRTIEICETIIASYPDNMVALYLLAINEKNFQTKIDKLKQIHDIHPTYARVLKEIGVIYGFDKHVPDKAITWFKMAIEKVPEYDICYSNIGIIQSNRKEYQAAMPWFFKSIEWEKKYGSGHEGLMKVFTELHYSDEQIETELRKYNVLEDFFYFNLGEANFNEKRYEAAIKYYNKSCENAQQLRKQIYRVYNSIGLAYFNLQNYEEAVKYQKKSVEANPKNYQAYFNLGAAYEQLNMEEDAVENYQKAVEVNPRDSATCNHLAKIYQNNSNYEEGIKYYKKVVQQNPNSIHASINLGSCYFKLKNYRECFTNLSKAREQLPKDNTQLEQSKKRELQTPLESIKKDGDAWRQRGTLTTDQKERVSNNIKILQDKLKYFDNELTKQFVTLDKVLKKEIVEIVSLVHEDEYELSNIDRIYDLVSELVSYNEEYFQIIPQLFVQNYYKNSMAKKRAILDIQNEQQAIARRLMQKTLKYIDNQHDKEEEQLRKKRADRVKKSELKHFNPPNSSGISILREKTYYATYNELYSEILRISTGTKVYFDQFQNLTDEIVKQSQGSSSGVEMKLGGEQQQDNFGHILKIFFNIFRTEFATQQKKIIWKIDQNIRDRLNHSKVISRSEVMKEIKQVWSQQITNMLQQRKQDRVETKCPAIDFMNAKIKYKSVEELQFALRVTDQLCSAKGYNIIEKNSRMDNQQKQDVILKIQIKEVICELRLAISDANHDETKYYLVQTLQEIGQSPLGCIYGSYVFLQKDFHYPLFQNCVDIAQNLIKLKKKDAGLEDKKTLASARYIMSTLTQK